MAGRAPGGGTVKWPHDPERRRRMIEALLVWTEELDREEPLPEGVDPASAGEAPDLASTVAVLEALRADVGLQGKAFQRLADRVEAEEEPGPDPDRLRAEGRRDTVGRLLEARDRLARLLDAGCDVEPLVAAGPFGAARRREAFAGLLEGMRLALRATDEALGDLDCREIRVKGLMFDPSRMRAVERAEANEGKPGTVVEVLRAGWLLGDEVLRPAEVRAVPEVTK